MRAGFLAVLLAVAAGKPALAEDSIVTAGTGVLTMCRSWLVYTSCQDYNHVTVPTRVKVGESLELVFGSNTKKIQFPVARITRQGDRCTAYNEASGGSEKVDKLEFEPCRSAAP